MKRLITILAVFLFSTTAQLKSPEPANLRFEISYPESANKDALDGRLLLLISTNNEEEPRLQINEDLTTQQVFGIDVDAWKAGQTKTVDQNAFGYPVRSLADVKPGQYWVQALLHRYETFKRADGHTVKLPMYFVSFGGSIGGITLSSVTAGPRGDPSWLSTGVRTTILDTY